MKEEEKDKALKLVLRMKSFSSDLHTAICKLRDTEGLCFSELIEQDFSKALEALYDLLTKTLFYLDFKLFRMKHPKWRSWTNDVVDDLEKIGYLLQIDEQEAIE